VIDDTRVADMGKAATRNDVVVRDAVEGDMHKIQAIYAFHVINGLASFEETPPTVAEMLSRRAATLARGFPYLVAEADGDIAGYAYAGPYRTRPAYRFTIEDSVYVDEKQHRRGIGTLLLKTLIARCETGPWRQMVAIIGDSGNVGSIALHARFGFRHVGTLEGIGFKHKRWVDTVLMQRALGRSD
jgi:L-amino acid N-acyltransferase YncA